MPIPQALVYKFHQPSESLLVQAGPPCRPVLPVYKDIDLLRSFLTIIEDATSLLAVPITAIQGKAFVVKNESNTYAIKLPNKYEHH